MKREQLRILYCDDQKHYRDEFFARHENHFKIEMESDISKVFSTLRGRTRAELPDLLLLDLYHDTNSAGDGQSERIREANAALASLDIAIRNAKECVDRAWRAVGVDFAEQIRQHYSARSLPIAIYTKRGLLLLDDEQVQRIEGAQLESMLKDGERFSAKTEVLQIERIVERGKKSRRMPRDIRIAVWGVLASLAGSLATLAIQSWVL